MVTALVASLGAAMVHFSSAITARQIHAIDTKRAIYVAEAGLTESYLAIALGKTGNVGSPDVPALFGNSLYWVEAVDLPDDMVAITSTGMAELRI